MSWRKTNGFSSQRGVEKQFGVVKAQPRLEVFVNDFDGDSLGVERPLAAVLAEQTLAEEQAEIDEGQIKLGGDLLQQMGFARTRAASDDGEFVVCTLRGTNCIKELGERNGCHPPPRNSLA